MSVSFSLISCSWLDRRSHRFSTIGEVTEVGEVSCCEEEVECHDGTESNNNNNNNGEKVSQCCRVWEKRDNIHPADGWCRKRHGRKKETKRKKKKMGGLKEFPVIWRADAAISNAPLKDKKYVAALNELWLVRFSLLPHWNSLSRVEQSCQRHPITAVSRSLKKGCAGKCREISAFINKSSFSQCVPFSFF